MKKRKAESIFFLLGLFILCEFLLPAKIFSQNFKKQNNLKISLNNKNVNAVIFIKGKGLIVVTNLKHDTSSLNLREQPNIKFLPKNQTETYWLMFDKATNKLSLINPEGKTLAVWEAKNDTVNKFCKKGEEFIVGLHCSIPEGIYKVNEPIATKSESFGFWKIPLGVANDIMYQRGILIHGGGKCSKEPLASEQGWCVTLGCIRMQNKDLEILIKYLTEFFSQGKEIKIEIINTML